MCAWEQRTCKTILFPSYIEVIPKWSVMVEIQSRFSDMETHSTDSVDSTESNKSLKHELGLIQRSSLSPVSVNVDNNWKFS